MTNAEKIIRYLKKRKNATYPEISKATGIGYETVKRTANKHMISCIVSTRKCRVTGKIRNAYALV